MQLLSTRCLDSHAHMSTNNHLTVGGHSPGLNPAETGRSVTDNPVSSAGDPPTTLPPQPSVHSLAANVDLYFRHHPSGMCQSLNEHDFFTRAMYKHSY